MNRSFFLAFRSALGNESIVFVSGSRDVSGDEPYDDGDFQGFPHRFRSVGPFTLNTMLAEEDMKNRPLFRTAGTPPLILRQLPSAAWTAAQNPLWNTPFDTEPPGSL